MTIFGHCHNVLFTIKTQDRAFGHNFILSYGISTRVLFTMLELKEPIDTYDNSYNH